MELNGRQKIIRLLGVGFDQEDGHIRITRGENYEVMMGSDECHEYIHELVQQIESALKVEGKDLNDLSPDELIEFIRKIR